MTLLKGLGIVLLSVTVLHPMQRVELFRTILHCLISQGLGRFVLKI